MTLAVSAACPGQFPYNDELKHTYQDYVTDPHINYLTNPNYSTDFKSKANASMTWLVSKWSTTLFVNRYGRTPNYAAQASNGYTAPGAGKLGAWILWNSSITYNPIKSLGLSFLVDNLFNRMPPIDHTLPGTTSFRTTRTTTIPMVVLTSWKPITNLAWTTDQLI